MAVPGPDPGIPGHPRGHAGKPFPAVGTDGSNRRESGGKRAAFGPPNRVDGRVEPGHDVGPFAGLYTSCLCI
jgi:hypothetical protein